MERKLDGLGRIVIPVEFREKLGIDKGTALDMTIVNNALMLRKVEEKPSNQLRAMRITNDKERIAKLRRLYTPGTRVKCHQMNNELYPVPKDTIGIVECVDDIGSIFVKWENGSGLALVEGDSFSRIDRHGNTIDDKE